MNVGICLINKQLIKKKYYLKILFYVLCSLTPPPPFIS